MSWLRLRVRPLRDGKRFSGALAEQEQLFPQLYISIVKAAEDTSDLPHALSRYIAYQQSIDSVRGKLISASIYPLILLVVGGAVSAFLIGLVVPRFAEVYQGAARLLGLPPGEVMMVAAHPRDLEAAQRVGLKAAYVPRPLEYGPEGRQETGPHAVFDVAAGDFLDLAVKLGA